MIRQELPIPADRILYIGQELRQGTVPGVESGDVGDQAVDDSLYVSDNYSASRR
jgi:hypothetical protein